MTTLYNLAKQMKELGFPKDWGEWKDHDQELLQKTWGMYGKRYSPTLEEVIEACKGGRRHFVLEHHMGRYNGWTAKLGKTITKKHPTPLEAVCKLWISLNQKTI